MKNAERHDAASLSHIRVSDKIPNHFSMITPGNLMIVSMDLVRGWDNLAGYKVLKKFPVGFDESWSRTPHFMAA